MRAWMREWYGVDMPDMVGMMEAMQNGRMPVAGMPMGSMPMGITAADGR